MRREVDAIRSLQRFAAGFLLEPWDIRLLVEQGGEPERPYALVEQDGMATSDGSKNRQDVTIAYTINLYLPRPEEGGRAAADEAALEVRELVFQAVKWGPDLHAPTPDRIPLYSYEPRNHIQRVRVRGATAGTWRIVHDTGTTAPLEWNAGEGDVQDAMTAIDPGNVLVVTRGGGVFDLVFVADRGGEFVPAVTVDDSALVSPTVPTVKQILHGAEAPWRSPSDYMSVLSFGQNTVRDADDPALIMVAVDLRCTFARTLPLPFDHMLLQRLSATDGNGG